MAGDQDQPGGRNDWRVRVATAIGASSGAALGLLLGPQVDLGGGLWQGLVLFLCFVIAGMLLGRLPAQRAVDDGVASNLQVTADVGLKVFGREKSGGPEAAFVSRGLQLGSVQSPCPPNDGQLAGAILFRPPPGGGPAA